MKSYVEFTLGMLGHDPGAWTKLKNPAKNIYRIRCEKPGCNQSFFVVRDKLPMLFGGVKFRHVWKLRTSFNGKRHTFFFSLVGCPLEERNTKTRSGTCNITEDSKDSIIKLPPGFYCRRLRIFK